MSIDNVVEKAKVVLTAPNSVSPQKSTTLDKSVTETLLESRGSPSGLNTAPTGLSNEQGNRQIYPTYENVSKARLDDSVKNRNTIIIEESPVPIKPALEILAPTPLVPIKKTVQLDKPSLGSVRDYNPPQRSVVVAPVKTTYAFIVLGQVPGTGVDHISALFTEEGFAKLRGDTEREKMVTLLVAKYDSIKDLLSPDSAIPPSHFLSYPKLLGREEDVYVSMDIRYPYSNVVLYRFRIVKFPVNALDSVLTPSLVE